MARTAVPKLLNEVERLKEELERHEAIKKSVININAGLLSDNQNLRKALEDISWHASHGGKIEGEIARKALGGDELSQ